MARFSTIYAELADPPIQKSGLVPIVLFPKGTHTISPKIDGSESHEEITVSIDENTFERLNKNLLAQYDGQEVVADYNHQNGSEIAGWLKGLTWDAEKGIIALISWSSVAAQKIREKLIRYISPSFLVDKATTEIVALANPFAGLTNNPAFVTLKQTPLQAENNRKSMEENKDNSLILVSAEKQEISEDKVEQKTEEKVEATKAEGAVEADDTKTEEKAKAQDESSDDSMEAKAEVDEEKVEDKEEKKEEPKQAEAPSYLTKTEAEAMFASFKASDLPSIINDIIEKKFAEASKVKAEQAKTVEATKSATKPQKTIEPTRIQVQTQKVQKEVILTPVEAQNSTLDADVQKEKEQKRNELIQKFQAQGKSIPTAWKLAMDTDPSLFF